MNFLNYNILLTIPEFFFFFLFLFLFIYYIFYLNKFSILHIEFNVLVNLFLLLVLFLYINLFYNEGVSFSYSLYNNVILINVSNTIIKILILVLNLIYIIISFNYVKVLKINTFEFLLLLLLSIFGLLFMMNSNNFIIFYLSIELQSLSLYVLISMNKNNIYSIEAALKYFIIGSFSSCILLFGISFLYGFTGHLNFVDVQLLFSHITYYHIFFLIGSSFSILLISLAFLFKMYAAPFHLWIQDIYQYSSNNITLILATIPSLILITIMFKMYYYIFEIYAWEWEFIFTFCGFSSIILGALGGLYQKKIKRLIAYSSINNIGYILISFIYMDFYSIYYIYIYYIIYLMNNIFFFIILLSISKKNKLNFYFIDTINDLKGLFLINKPLTLLFSLTLFSLSGIPPLAGFFSKLYIFLHVYNHSSLLILCVIILASLLSAFYYLRIISILYYKEYNFNYIYNYPSLIQSIFLFWIILFMFFFLFKSDSISIYSQFLSLCI